MRRNHRIKIILSLICALLPLVLIFCALYFYFRKRVQTKMTSRSSLEAGDGGGAYPEEGDSEAEELINFAGGGNLTAGDILDAPAEVVGKSSYETLYKATIQQSNSVVLLRFVRPACVGRTEEVLPAVRLLGSIRHPNLVPLRALYVGPRGEKLFVHPFYGAGTLAHLVRAGMAEARRWDIIYNLSCGIAKGLHHLHTGLDKPIVHGNLKPNNILLEADYRPRLSDFALHYILNPVTSQKLLEASLIQGHTAPELIKMTEASRESDIYSLGLILLQIVTQIDPVNNDFLHSSDPNLPISSRHLVIEQITDQNLTNEEGLVALHQLAIDCCSPSPTKRPDINHVLQKLEEIGR